MRAVTADRYGPPEVLQSELVELPVPGPREALVRVHAAAVTAGDVAMRGFRNVPPSMVIPARAYLGIRRPRCRVLGMCIAGVVERAGPGFDRCAVGEAVFGSTGMRCGGYAEYALLQNNGAVARQPDAIGFSQAAAIVHGGLSAMHFLRRAELRSGERVLIHGASGGVGSAAVQLATNAGAHVTGVCSGPKREFVSSLGAGTVLDYASEEPSGEFDVILDAHGSLGWLRAKRLLARNGRFLSLRFGVSTLLWGVWARVSSRRRVICDVASERAEDLEGLAALMASGAFRSRVDRSFALGEAAEAHRYFESGRAIGGVILVPVQG